MHVYVNMSKLHNLSELRKSFAFVQSIRCPPPPSYLAYLGDLGRF